MTNTAKAKILIIEDSEEFRKIYSDRFTFDGYEVLEAVDGEQGLLLMKKELPDLILLDIVMPKKDGFEVLREMMQDKELKGIPVIILSILGEEKDIKKGLELGASDYTMKGFYSPNEILSKIRSLLARKDVRRYIQKYKLAINTNKYDSAKLAKDYGFVAMYKCKNCGEEKFLELIPQTSREDWFDAHFVCDCNE